MKESQLDNKTSIATNDCVRMVDENGNSVKIKKDSFMAAIRDALPSILESGGTGGGSVLSVIGGILKTRTDADLASVLGACKTVIKKRPQTTVIELFTFNININGSGTIPGTAIKINISVTDWIDYFNIDLNFVDVNQQAVAYGFKDNIDGVIGSSNTFSNNFYLEQDSDNKSLYHVKMSTHSSDPVNIIFREITAVRTTITYTMAATTIGNGAVLLGQTTK